MGTPSIPKFKEPKPPPSMIDPTVMFARQREKQKALQSTGRHSTILSSPYVTGTPKSESSY